MIKVADFFCGIGGIRKGFEEASNKFKFIFSNDIDKYCAETYKSNFGEEEFILKDIGKLNLSDIPNFDIFTAGFPCQSFSIAGKGLGFEDKRGQVFFEIIKILKNKKPKCIFLENVKNLENHKKGETFKIVKKELEGLGYHLKHKVLNTSEYGDLPQNRERIYIVGFLDSRKTEKFTFPSKIKLEKTVSQLIEEKVSEKYHYTDDSKIYEKLEENVTEDIYIDNKVYQYRRVYVRENKSGLCPTITSNCGQGGHNVPIILDNSIIRKLTPRECFRLQGFPDSFVFPEISDCQLYKQIGNSVSVPVIKRIAEEIIKVI